MEQELDGYGLITLIWLVVVYWQIRNSLKQPPRNERKPSWGVGKGLTLSKQGQAAVSSRSGSDDATDWGQIAEPGSELACALMAIHRADHSFDAQHFLTGAASAYEAIVSAFAAGDRASLEHLLSHDVYEAFAAAIAEREQRGEHMELSFVSVGVPQILEANLSANSAQVTVRFISEMVAATWSGTNAVASGDPTKVVQASEIWTFARDVFFIPRRLEVDCHRYQLSALCSPRIRFVERVAARTSFRMLSPLSGVLANINPASKARAAKLNHAAASADREDNPSPGKAVKPTYLTRAIGQLRQFSMEINRQSARTHPPYLRIH